MRRHNSDADANAAHDKKCAAVCSIIAIFLLTPASLVSFVLPAPRPSKPPRSSSSSALQSASAAAPSPPSSLVARRQEPIVNATTANSPPPCCTSPSPDGTGRNPALCMRFAPTGGCDLKRNDKALMQCPAACGACTICAGHPLHTAYSRGGELWQTRQRAAQRAAQKALLKAAALQREATKRPAKRAPPAAAGVMVALGQHQKHQKHQRQKQQLQQQRQVASPIRQQHRARHRAARADAFSRYSDDPSGSPCTEAWHTPQCREPALVHTASARHTPCVLDTTWLPWGRFTHSHRFPMFATNAAIVSQAPSAHAASPLIAPLPLPAPLHVLRLTPLAVSCSPVDMWTVATTNYSENSHALLLSGLAGSHTSGPPRVLAHFSNAEDPRGIMHAGSVWIFYSTQVKVGLPFRALLCPSVPFRALPCPSVPFRALPCPYVPFRALLCPSVPFCLALPFTSAHPLRLLPLAGPPFTHPILSPVNSLTTTKLLPTSSSLFSFSPHSLPGVPAGQGQGQNQRSDGDAPPPLAISAAAVLGTLYLERQRRHPKELGSAAAVGHLRPLLTLAGAPRRTAMRTSFRRHAY